MNEIQARICSMTKEDFANLPKLGDEGFDGFNPNKDTFCSLVIIPHGWSIDCLPCGYLRLFVTSGYDLILERPYWNGSNFEVYAEEKEK